MSDKWVLVPVEPTPEMLEPMAREDCKHDGFDPDEPMPPHGQYPRWYDRCGPLAEIYLAMLAARPAAPVQEDEVERVAMAMAACEDYKWDEMPEEQAGWSDWPDWRGWYRIHARAAIRALKREEG
jgi:hypothetical protein